MARPLQSRSMNDSLAPLSHLVQGDHPMHFTPGASALRPVALRFAKAVLLATALGAPRAEAQLPTVHTGGSVSVYATFPTDPAGISFDAFDNLFVGNFNIPGLPDVVAPVFRVDAGDSSVTPCANVADPDAVYVDRNGLFAAPGTLLVGGWEFGTTTGRIVAVPAGCGGGATIASGGLIDNVASFAEDALGNFYIANGSANTICVWDGTTLSPFGPVLPAFPAIAIDGARIFISSAGTIQEYDLSGSVVDPAFSTGAVLAVGPAGSDFEGVLVARGDALVAIDPVTKSETLILSGPGANAYSVAFDSAGDLYFSQGGTFDRILHVTRAGATSSDAAPSGGHRLSLLVSPNPVRDRAFIDLATPAGGFAQVEMFDVSGRKVLSIHDGALVAGHSRWSIDARTLAQGVYFVAGRTPTGLVVRKVALVK